ncbi:MAG TPA: hypothetical protein VE860_15100 [Chthoniobacterales bacterium]|nr:hypothetical protein [Chthoniobacterales bacterium]
MRKEDFAARVYDVERWVNDHWEWCGLEDARDPVPLPQEVHDRIAKGITGKYTVAWVTYRIRTAQLNLDKKYTN